MKTIISLLLINFSLLSQISTDTLFTLKGVPVSFDINAEGMVLSHITKFRDPYYHASAYLNSVIKTNIGKNVKVPVRIISEVRNFSESYSSRENVVFWIKPALQVRLNKFLGLDSAVLNVGDLWRQKHGQGLMLDQFESQGGEVTFYKNKIFLNARDIGFGYSGPDDIFTVSAGYDSVFAVRFLMNILNGYDNYFDNSFSRYDYYSDIKIISIDSYKRLNNNISIYEEAALNPDNYSKAALIGCNINYNYKRSFISAKAEFRYYEKDFFFKEGTPALPYFESVTALDKSINIYYLYMNRTDETNYTLGGRIKGRIFLYDDFFADADLEPVVGSINMFAYEASIGIEPEKDVLLKAGIMNKFINTNYYDYYGNRLNYWNIDMFHTDKKPFLFAKATFSL